MTTCTIAGAIAAIAIACGSSSSDGPPTPTSPVDASGAVDGQSGGDASPASPADGGTSGDASDGAASSSGVGGNAFTSAPAYAPTLGPSTLRPEHEAAFGTQNPAKHDCSDCHLFAAAGSVFTDATGSTPVAAAEVRLRTAADGKAISAYTDANGNFFIEQSSAFLAGLQFPFQAGVRTDAGVALMAPVSNDGSCNNTSCHGGTQGWVHAP